jgi:glycine/D-amino acid oxidase-like deaminating enzyme
MRVTVIGAGVVGTHVAVALARRGAEVTLLDRGEPGQGTTAGSFAWIDASHPGLASYLDLRVRGVRAWQRQADELGRPPWVALPGTLSWPGPDEGIEEHLQRLDAHGCGPRRLSAGDARSLEPDLIVPGDTDTLYHFEGEGWVEASPAIAALLDRGRAAGIRVRTHVAVESLLLDESGCVGGVGLAGGERLEGDLVVSCAGRWTGSLAAGAGIDVPMVPAAPHAPPSLGLVVRTTPGPARVGRVIRGDGLLVRPEPGGRLLVHSEAHDSMLETEGAPPPGAAEEVLARLAERIRGASEMRVEAARICVRALPADLMPVVGPALDGLYVVATHSGITLAPALGELVASELIDERESEELQPFRPARFGRAAA